MIPVEHVPCDHRLPPLGGVLHGVVLLAGAALEEHEFDVERLHGLATQRDRQGRRTEGREGVNGEVVGTHPGRHHLALLVGLAPDAEAPVPVTVVGTPAVVAEQVGVARTPGQLDVQRLVGRLGDLDAEQEHLVQLRRLQGHRLPQPDLLLLQNAHGHAVGVVRLFPLLDPPSRVDLHADPPPARLHATGKKDHARGVPGFDPVHLDALHLHPVHRNRHGEGRRPPSVAQVGDPGADFHDVAVERIEPGGFQLTRQGVVRNGRIGERRGGEHVLEIACGHGHGLQPPVPQGPLRGREPGHVGVHDTVAHRPASFVRREGDRDPRRRSTARVGHEHDQRLGQRLAPESLLAASRREGHAVGGLLHRNDRKAHDLPDLGLQPALAVCDRRHRSPERVALHRKYGRIDAEPVGEGVHRVAVLVEHETAEIPHFAYVRERVLRRRNEHAVGHGRPGLDPVLAIAPDDRREHQYARDRSAVSRPVPHRCSHASLPAGNPGRLARQTGRYSAPKKTSARPSSHGMYQGQGRNRKGDAVSGASHRYM